MVEGLRHCTSVGFLLKIVITYLCGYGKSFFYISVFKGAEQFVVIISPDSDDISFSVSMVNQRETFVIWDRNTGKPVYKAVLWQCRRGARFCQEIVENGYEATVREHTGLIPDPFFSASGVKWVLDNVESVRERAENGNLFFGTIDTWLIWKLTHGKVHATDYSNASRTMLFNIRDLEWDSDMLKLFVWILDLIHDTDDLRLGKCHPQTDSGHSPCLGESLEYNQVGTLGKLLQV